MTPSAAPWTGGRALIGIALAGGVASGGLVAYGVAIDPTQALLSYLTAYAYLASIVLGALVFAMICHAMRAVWPVVIRRLCEATFATLPLFGVLALPILAGAASIYPWMHPERIADPRVRALLVHKLPWLNAPSFIARSIIYLGVWTGAGHFLRAWSLRDDESDGGAGLGRRQRVLSAALLPAVGLSLTFASFDWLMSLSPDWSSTMFGVYFFAGGFLAALALVTVIAARARQTGLVPGLTLAHFHALGRLLLAFVVFWGYLAFFQFFLIWIANKPVEARWYLDRTQGPARSVSFFLLWGHLALPLFVLLPHRTKRSIGALTAISAWLLAAHYADVHWLVNPAGSRSTPFHWMDWAALAALAGLSVAFAAWRQRGHRLAAVGDPAYPAALRYESW